MEWFISMKNINGINIDELKNAAQNGTVDDFIDKNLSKEASEKLKNILADKEATQKMLNTPQAKQLFEKLMKG